MRIREEFNVSTFLRSQADLLWNLLIIVLVAMTILTVLAKKVKEEKAKKKLQVLVMPLNAALSFAIKWPKGPEDIDLWVVGPDGVPVGFKNTRTKALGYLRDDTGDETPKTNQELVTAPELIPGHYLVNAHFYENHGGKNTMKVECQILIRKKSGKIEEVYRGLAVLGYVRDEKTFIQFDIGFDGKVVKSSINHNFQSIMPFLENN